MRRSRQGGQAVIEFGIVALLFTALMFAVVDFGLLLNTWLAVSAGTRDIARNASVGKRQPFLWDEALHLPLPSVSGAGFTSLCCSGNAAVEVRVTYFPPGCPPWNRNPVCPGIQQQSNVSSDAPFLTVDQRGTGPAAASCGPPMWPNCHPQPDDLVVITVIANGAQVITPLIRPAFGCTNGSSPTCNVSLRSTVIMRYEGQEFQ